MPMQAGDVIFVRGHNWISDAIRFFDKGQFSHVCIAISDTEILETDLFTNAKIVPFHYDDYELIRLNLTPEQRAKVPEIANQLVGIKYDYLLVIWYMLKSIFKLKKPWELARHMICSELVDFVLYGIGAIPAIEYLSGESPNIMYSKIKLLSSNGEVAASP
jgi:hypothetical protein